jgi:pilus assembly protein CpaB
MNRRLISVLLALVLAAVGTAAVLLYLRAADDRAIEGKQARTVLIAEKQIPAGTSGQTLLKNGYVRKDHMPAETLPSGALQGLDEVHTLVTTAGVQKGQLLLKAMFGTEVKNVGGLAIPPDKMAITARVKSTVFGPATVQAGARVAIFYTYTPWDNEHRNSVSGGLVKGQKVNSVTRVLMPNVEVISVGPAPANDGPTTTGLPGTNANASSDQLSVTLAVNQEEAQKLAHAVAIGGELNIALLGDPSVVKPDDGVDNHQLF